MAFFHVISRNLSSPVLQEAIIMYRNRAFMLLLSFLLPAGSAIAQAKATAAMIDSKGKRAGEILFEQHEEGVKVRVHITNLDSGQYAIHIHEFGKCQPPDFKSAGGHFNPENKKHGFFNPEGPHAGDLLNFEVSEEGKAEAEMTTNLVTLEKDAPNSLLKNDGTTVVVHKGADDYLTDPAGHSGPRVACGIIIDTP